MYQVFEPLYIVWTMVVLYLLMRAVSKRLDRWQWSSCGSVGKVQHGTYESALRRHALLHSAAIGVVVLVAWYLFKSSMFINLPGFVAGQLVVCAGHCLMDLYAFSAFKKKGAWEAPETKRIITTSESDPQQPPKVEVKQESAMRKFKTDLDLLAQLYMVATVMTVIVTRGTS
ncbi:hypothetical protein [Actinomadura verrucosospora]|uniref:Uncharacterized protein n=1 Tax=Actinomadura verrucosospora TaxID=46165 RepID=A0A7D3VTR3_ACTVE|nr:hypothetical protein [Actinomadura verrucosospora]QKG22538.1 hypothetical protein ACTIVE_4178 [Actinomadura verrucosospora]